MKVKTDLKAGGSVTITGINNQQSLLAINVNGNGLGNTTNAGPANNLNGNAVFLVGNNSPFAIS
jgi:hypothetical protein